MAKKITIDHVFKIFGEAPQQALELVRQGCSKHEILERTGASSATISRVARSLTDSDGGYERIFARMKGEK